MGLWKLNKSGGVGGKSKSPLTGFHGSLVFE